MIKQFKIRDFQIFSLMGFVGIYLYYKFFYLALVKTSTQVAFIINYTWALWIVIFSFFILNESFSKKKLTGITIDIIGVSFILTNGSLDFKLVNYDGVLYALLGAISYGLFSVLTKKLKYDKVVSVFFYYFFSLIFIAVDIYLSKENINFNFSFSEIMGILYIGIACSGFGFVFWTKALEYGETSIISNLILLVLFMALVYI